MKEVKGFKNSYILTEQGIIKTNLLIENGIITKIGDFEVDGLTLLDEDKIVVPGFIDEHIHGSSGSDVIDGTIASLTNIAESLLEEGTTAFLATTTTSSKEVLEKSLTNVKEYIDKNNNFVPEICVKITTKILEKHGLDYTQNKLQHVESLTIYPSDYFSPKKMGTEKITITSNTYGIHLYASSWYKGSKLLKKLKYRLIPLKEFVKYKILKRKLYE